MDARELTKVVTDHGNKLFTMEKQVEYLTQELEKIRLIVGDIQIDIKMMERKNG